MDPRAGRLLLLALLVCGLIQGAAAEEIFLEDVPSFNFSAASSNLAISQVNLYDLREGVTTVNLDAYGEPYQLEVNCTRSWGWWTWDVSLTYSNGTVSTETLKNLAPLALDYDCFIQYWYLDTDWILDADIYVDFIPRSVTYGVPSPQTRGTLVFSSVSGSSANPFDVKIFAVPEKELDEIRKNDIFSQFGRYVNGIFLWTWSGILWFVEQVPVIGPYLAALLELSGAVIGEIVAWGLFLLDNIEVILMFVEGLILADALLSTRSRALMPLLRRIVDNHVRALKFCLWLLELAIVLFTRLIQMVAQIVQTLKPL